MKKILLLCFVAITSFTGCEDVVDVDLPQETSRLIVDAIVRVNTSENIQSVTINVNLTNSFFEDIIPVPLADIDTLIMTNLDADPSTNANILSFSEVRPGVFESFSTLDFFTSGRIVLLLVYQGQTYASQTNYVPATPIDNLQQGDGILFDEDDTEVIITFTDNPGRDDFYIFDFDFDEFLVSEDTFYKDQQFEFSYFYDNNLLPGQIVNISILGADRSFYNYMDQIINQSDGSFGPFGIPATTVKGNIANVTGIEITDLESFDLPTLLNNIDSFDGLDNSDNFALGYFAVVQEFSETIVIQ